MIKRLILVLVVTFAGMNFSFGQVLLLKKMDSGSASKAATRIELAFTEWFFDQGLMILSEQNPLTEVELELALYMLQEVNARALLLWSLNSKGDFHLMAYGLNGEFWGEQKIRINLQDAELEQKVIKDVLPLLQKVKKSFQ